MSESPKYTVFIGGEAIDLCVPRQESVSDGWADWFNNSEVTRFLEQGRFPNLIEQQMEFFESIVRRERFALLIMPKGISNPVGTISLSNLNFEKRSCQVAMLIGEVSSRSKDRLFALEAMARVAEHGFEMLGMERIWAGQSFPALSKWNKHLELIGYRSEGILKNAFVKGRMVSDMVMLTCHYENYAKIKEVRGGEFWPGTDKMKSLIARMPEEGFAEVLAKNVEQLAKDYFGKIEYV